MRSSFSWLPFVSLWPAPPPSLLWRRSSVGLLSHVPLARSRSILSDPVSSYRRLVRARLVPYCNSDVMLRRSLALRSANGGEFMPAILLHIFAMAFSERETESSMISEKESKEEAPLE